MKKVRFIAAECLAFAFIVVAIFLDLVEVICASKSVDDWVDEWHDWANETLDWVQGPEA